jgi:hypothetical protein
MNAKIKTSEAPVLAVGHIDNDTFQAELYPEARIVVCYSPSLDNFLSNASTKPPASSIGVRLLTRHWMFMPFKHWLFVEVQACFGKVHIQKVAGLRIRNGGRSAHYEDLSPVELQILKPRLQRFQTQLNNPNQPKREAAQQFPPASHVTDGTQ